MLHPKALTIAVLFETGNLREEALKILETIPALQPISQALDPREFLESNIVVPDLLLIEVNGESQVPEWLESLSRRLPQTAIIAYSQRWKPNFLIQASRLGVQEFLTLPIWKLDIENAIERLQAIKKPVPGAHAQGYVIVVTGYKGGVGATTIAINLAVALEELIDDRLALVDLGRPFADIGKYLTQETTFLPADLFHGEITIDWTYLDKMMQPYSKKLDIFHGPSDLEGRGEIEIELLLEIFNMLRQRYKYIIVDLGHWPDELFFKIISEAHMVLMLSGLSIADLQNLKKIWPLLAQWDRGRGKIKIIVNRLNKGNSAQLSYLKTIIQAPPFETLPSDFLTVLEAQNQGTPLGIAAPRSKLWQKIKNMAERIQMETSSGDARSRVFEAPSKRRFWMF